MMYRSSIFFVLLSAFCTLANGQISSDLSCSTCLHLSFNITNVPSMVKTMIESLMSGIKLANPQCVSGSSNVQQCPAPSLQSMRWVNRCQVTTVHLKAVGMQELYPEAIMNAVLVVRGCIKRKVDQPDECTAFKDMDAETKAKMTMQLKRLEGQWLHANYTGQMCIEGGSGTIEKPSLTPKAPAEIHTTKAPGKIGSSTTDVTNRIKTALSTLEAVTRQTTVSRGEGKIEITTKKDGPENSSPISILSKVLLALSLLRTLML